MNVFDKYSIEEISKKTKISPISLKFIKNKEYEKIPKVKFLGFIKIIEREFNEDLSDLIKEYDEKVKIDEVEYIKPLKKENNQNNFLIIIASIILIITGIFLYKKINQPQKTTKSPNISEEVTTKENKAVFTNKKVEKINLTLQEKNKSNLKEVNNKFSKEINETNLTLKETNKTQFKQNRSITHITIIPQKLLWFRVKNLDNNKTYEYLTSQEKQIEGKNFYIKLGHGEVIIEYGDKNITPNTKKVVKLLLKDGNITYIKGKK